jgi:hypothetical protein
LSIAASPAYAEQKMAAPRGPDDAQQAAQHGLVEPEEIVSRGCITRPGQRGAIHFFTAAGNNFYSATPSKFFDVVMTIKVSGYRAVRVDHFFAGGTERFSFRVPRKLPVTVTISGFRGSTGCFFFDARP